MAENNAKYDQYKDLSADALQEQIAVHAANLLQTKLSQGSARKRGSVSKQRRQIARLLTQLRSITGL